MTVEPQKHVFSTFNSWWWPIRFYSPFSVAGHSLSIDHFIAREVSERPNVNSFLNRLVTYTQWSESSMWWWVLCSFRLVRNALARVCRTENEFNGLQFIYVASKKKSHKILILGASFNKLILFVLSSLLQDCSWNWIDDNSVANSVQVYSERAHLFETVLLTNKNFTIVSVHSTKSDQNMAINLLPTNHVFEHNGWREIGQQ